ncbi:predicted protein [Nematostella vectensis]|uniref:Uncharacterized protein n=1 Tax=Nematostella vectensis TaxID=45351 RepID=A7RRA6_NEMVE|nr:predicted protein [Nematostella vectensis]|eukprot:XP_001638040.1 predicted protein [Nematostella vectensis]
MFLGGGLFEVAKERDAEVIAFGEMLSEVRSNFHWYESSNRGYVLSPALPSRFGKTICNRETEVVVVIFTEGRRDTFRFAIDTWASVKEVLELTLSCLSNSDVNIEHASTTHVLKICGRSEYLEAQRKLVEYEYIQECLKFQKEVQFVLLENEKVSRHLARTASDDEIDLVPRSYKDFFNLSHTTAVSQYGLTVLVESFTEETSRLLQEATSLVNPKFEPSPIIQLTKAICSTLASIETADIHVAVDALNLFHEVNKNSAVLNVTILKNLLSNLTDSVFLLIEMYCDAFDTEFASSQISRPGLSGTLDVSSMTDKLKVHISSAHRIPLYWKQDFENFSVDGGVYYGGCLLCPIETTTQSKLTRKFSELLQWGDWLKFDIPVKRLPRESRLCLTLYGTKPSSKGNPSARSALGWVALQLFNFNGVLLTGTQILGLWPDSKANPVGSCTSNLLHPNSVLLLVTFERYLSEIVFPDCSDFPGFDDMDHCIPEADYGLFEEILMKDLFNELKPNERSILWEHRFYCRSVPRALPLVLSSAPSWEIQSLPEIYKLLHTWSPMSPVDAMELLKVNFPDRHVRSMAVRWMANFSDDELCDYLPQLVQALKYEIYHDSALTRFLVRRALGNVRLMHLLFWFLKDKISEPQFGQRFQVILGGLLNICGEAQKEEFTFQDDLVTELIKVARKVKSAKDSARNNILQQELAALAGKLCCVFRLPITPSLEVVGMDVRSCGYFTSNSAPLRLVFRNVDPFGENVNVIFKMGDDMRQDTLTMQLVGIMNKIWLQEGLDLKIITYQCMATGPGMGMIEIVSDSQTLREIHTEFGLTGSFKDESINRWLLKFNPDEKEYRRAVENFTASCAGYCVATYVLGICDRHNDNIMIHRSGHLFHIDFSKILGHAQMFGNFKRDRAPFVLTPDMAYVINGGYRPSPRFQHFIDLCSRAFNLIRRHSNLFLNLLSLMLNSGIGSLGNVSDLRYIRDSLLPQESEAEATAAFTRLIESSLSSWFTQVNFFIHNVAQIRDVSQLKRTSSGNASISLLSFALKTYTLEMDGFIESARVVDYQKRYNTEKYYIYVINICRANSDQATFVFRRFGHFIELHAKLSELYPDIALPRLPARIYLGRSQIRTVAERRRAELDTFLRHLLMMPQEISESDVLYTFLHPIPEVKSSSSCVIDVLIVFSLWRSPCVSGQIKLSIRHERGALRVMVMHAKDLSSRNSSTAGDPYVKLYLLPDPSKTTKLKTKIAKKSQNPTYNETLVYSNLSAADLKTRHLQVTVWDHDRVGENDFMGGVVINLADMDSSINITNWYPLKDIRS